MKTVEAEMLSIALNSMLDIKGIAGLKIARNQRMINDELKEYYRFKQELFKKYGEEKDGNLIIQKDSENYPSFVAEIKPLEENEVSFDFRKLTEQELIDSGMTAKQMQLIWDWMVEID